MKTSWAGKHSIPFGYRVVNFISWVVLRLFFRLKVYGQKNPYKGAAIIAANHTSYLDPPLLGIAWPEEVHFLAKDTLFKVPIFGWFIRKLNAHPLSGSSGDVAVIKLACKLLNEGKKVVLFPEGRRSETNELAPIKPGMGLFVSKTNAAIIPTYIFGTLEALPRKRKFPILWKKIGCVFGTPIKWASFEHLEKKEAQAALAEKLTKAILDLKAWYEAGAKGSPP